MGGQENAPKPGRVVSDFDSQDHGAYGELLSFDLAQAGAGCQNLGDWSAVVLRGGGHVLTRRRNETPANGFTAFSIRLDERSGWRNSGRRR